LKSPLKKVVKRHFFARDKGGDPHKGFFTYSLNLDEGEDSKKGQPPFPPIFPGWGGMPPN
jgi:hypothetical protein